MIDAVFLDRDGIINEVVMRGDVVGSPRNLEEFKIRDEFSHFYQKIAALELPLLVVSNQPDVRRNLMSQRNLDLMTEIITKKFPRLEISYCIHDDRDCCSCRKPQPGMITNLLKKHDFFSKRSIIIGDGEKDIEAGLRAGLTTILLRTSYNRAPKCTPHLMVQDLSQALSILTLWNTSISHFQNAREKTICRDPSLGGPRG